MEALEAIFRWMHVFAGIIWIGHLYFFNWVNGPFQGKIDGPTKKVVNPELMPRALYWFRWGAAYTWITGVLLLMLVYYHGQQVLASGAEWSAGTIIMIVVTFVAVFLYDALWKTGLANNLRAAVITSYVLLAIVVALFVYFGNFSYRGTLIHTGALFGTIMAFNVWFRIWPAQQKIAAGCQSRQDRRIAIATQHLHVGSIAVGNDRPTHNMVRRRQLRASQ
jgi:uncharacterized membrane protein